MHVLQEVDVLEFIYDKLILQMSIPTLYKHSSYEN